MEFHTFSINLKNTPGGGEAFINCPQKDKRMIGSLRRTGMSFRVYLHLSHHVPNADRYKWISEDKEMDFSPDFGLYTTTMW